VGTGRNDVWAAGEGGVRHWDGSAWAKVDGPMGSAVWAGAPNDVWVVGANGAWHWDGTTWAERGQPGSLDAVWGADANHVWAVGSSLGRHGVVVRWDGTAWSPEPIDDPGPLTGVRGRGPNDVWVVGERSILHWDGTAWSVSAEVQDGGAGLHGVWVSPADQVWAVGQYGTVMRR